MAKSKRSVIDDFIRARVDEAIASTIADSRDTAETEALRRNRDVVKVRVASRVCWDDYRWLELCDIMDWKKRKIRE